MQGAPVDPHQQGLVAEIAEPRLAMAGRVERGAEAQEIIGDIVVIARHLHLDVELAPGRAMIGAGVDGEDVALIGEADAQARGSARRRARAAGRSGA